jgi:transcriptional regulator PpsR
VSNSPGTTDLGPQPFADPGEALGGVVDAETASALISASADLALVLDGDGRICDVSMAGGDLADLHAADWMGRLWSEVVTIESRPKVAEILRDVAARGQSRWRQLNHSVGRGPDVPIRYSAVRLNDSGRLVAIGRDMRSVATLQQRLVEAQQGMEREYQRIRSAETRYRLLFQLASEAVLIVEGATHRIVDANPAAAKLLGLSPRRTTGQLFADMFDESSRQAIQSLLAAARNAGRVDDVMGRLAESHASILLSASLFRQENTAHLLVRLRPLGGEGSGTSTSSASVLQVVERLPEAFVLTDLEHRVIAANSAFLDMAQLSTETQAKGQPVDRWIGRPGLDVDALFTSLRTHGSVRNFNTLMRGELDGVETVEIAAVRVEGGELPCIGFSIRTSGWRTDRVPAGPDLPSAQQFTDLVGRVSLKDMVRETTDVIERLCIEAALELTRDNRASAAEMLGLSRQSLYSKLRRFGLGDLDSDDV